MKGKRRLLCSLLCGIVTVLVTGGCGTPLAYPFNPKKTGAEGIILDQNARPVSNAQMRAFGMCRSCSWNLLGMSNLGDYECKFRSDERGNWRFYRRDVYDMTIGVYPPSGYKTLPGRPDETGDIHYGEYRTNVVLRLMKIEPAPQPKDMK